ncbi:hypothetical protein BUALT_Bualt08G0125600 [Buddleja alternifolia]|uniref:Uncharacterized protein n=1 Tax=Buddleja alternifolia TaxID=168488 RepID=A0AAV6X7H1_9LAMI|nr:hypothetical protein BUALT_Bualt08G0125600 [Buddleja alternifolia]
MVIAAYSYTVVSKIGLLMAKSKKLQTVPDSRRHGISPLKLSSRCSKVCGDSHHEKRRIKPSEKKEWENAVCSVCMEFPHNAVLLLCSSYDKGCRPYMCATSHRYSNCLEQYKKAYTKVTSNSNDVDFLLCPLCRGNVKGWTVVGPARRYLDSKKRNCMQDNCSFLGTYKELRKHVKVEHPLARPRDVDPSRAEKWKKLENERDLSDVFSTIRSTMPGAIVIGDYVIERNYRGPSTVYDGDNYLDDMNFRFATYGRGYDSLDEDLDRDGARAEMESRRSGNSYSGMARSRARLWIPGRAGRGGAHR